MQFRRPLNVFAPLQKAFTGGVWLTDSTPLPTNQFKPPSNEDESWPELMKCGTLDRVWPPTVINFHTFSSTLIKFQQIQTLKRVDGSWQEVLLVRPVICWQLLSASVHRGMKVEKTLMQALPCQLSHNSNCSFYSFMRVLSTSRQNSVVTHLKSREIPHASWRVLKVNEANYKIICAK
jgi:hypothetical protein